VDVRTAPGSRKHPQFGRDRLAAAATMAGIDYAWRKDLGGWRTPNPGSPHTALESSAFRGYADYMDTEEFRAALAWLMQRAAGGPTAFLCAESVWWRCHRRMIADALLAGGWTVLHLMGSGRAEPHRLHPAARLDGRDVVYDVDQPRRATLAD
jgi:uncharacterized protein (DUF488 family)